MTSDTRIAYGSRVARNARARPRASNQARTAARASAGAPDARSGIGSERTIARCPSYWPIAPSPVRIGAAFWVQRTDWPSLREAVVAAEAAGADDLWIDDHLLSDEGERTTPKLEGWSTLAAVAAVTTRARLGLLVAANTFRNPGLTAKLATTLDQISGGRAILGIGGGWFEDEHRAFGLDFGSGFGERLDRLGESVEIVRRLLDGERFSHDGRFYRLRDALAAPRPSRTTSRS